MAELVENDGMNCNLTNAEKYHKSPGTWYMVARSTWRATSEGVQIQAIYRVGYIVVACIPG